MSYQSQRQTSQPHDNINVIPKSTSYNSQQSNPGPVFTNISQIDAS